MSILTRNYVYAVHLSILILPLNSLLPISKQEICYILLDVSPTIVEVVLSGMLKNGLIEKVGAARATKYIKKR